MKLTAKLAYNQLMINHRRSVMTLVGIALSSAMLTAVCGFVASAKTTLYNAFGFDVDAPLNAAIIAIGAVLGTIIIAASVTVVSNAFRVSAGERTRQFGILKSIGATKKQIAASVLYEGMFLSIIGIPVGIAVGLIIDFIGVSVLTSLLNSMYEGGTLNVDSEAVLNVPFVAPPLMFVVAIIISFGTVLLSAWVPARKAAKISAIDAIRSAGEVKFNGKNVRTSKLVQIIFGFEGTLASKSLKRSRRSFRATVVSLTISIVMLITSGSFGALMNHATNAFFEGVDATAIVDWSSDIKMSFDDEGGTSKIDYIQLDSKTIKTITEKFQEYNGTEIYGIGGIRRYATKLSDDIATTSALISIDKKHYEELCKAAGVPVGSNLLMNLRRETVDGKKKEYAPYDFSEFKGKSLTFLLPGREPVEVTIDGELTWRNVPNEIINMVGTELTVIVPDCEAAFYTWFVKTDDPTGFAAYGKQVLADLAPKSTDEIDVYAKCMDIASITKQLNDLVNTIMFFVYGFVIMLTLIAVTSVISTISTNVRSRAKEFAALESVGMTKAGIKKMLNLESILCSVRSLLFGIPLGVLGAYGVYYGLRVSVEIPFTFPWIAVLQCAIGVFAVTWVTMRYSVSQLRSESIVETIRGGSGI